MCQQLFISLFALKVKSAIILFLLNCISIIHFYITKTILTLALYVFHHTTLFTIANSLMNRYEEHCTELYNEFSEFPTSFKVKSRAHLSSSRHPESRAEVRKNTRVATPRADSTVSQRVPGECSCT